MDPPTYGNTFSSANVVSFKPDPRSNLYSIHKTNPEIECCITRVVVWDRVASELEDWTEMAGKDLFDVKTPAFYFVVYDTGPY
jgi:hypothetical protein